MISDSNEIKETLTNFVVPIVCLLVSGLLVFFVIIKSTQNWPLLQEEFSKAQTLEALLNTKKGVLNKLIDFQAVVEENGRLFSQALSSDPLVPELLTQVDIIAKDSGLEVSRLSYSVTDVGGSGVNSKPVTYKAVIVNLGTLGNYDQINTFLSNLENSSRLIEVVTYRFSGENLQETNKYAATFILRVPYLKVESMAQTDAPVTLDISSPDFINALNKVKALKFYDIKVDSKFLQVKPSDKEAVEDVDGNLDTSKESTPENN
ncbi:type 4a pilus biogenesis protein PilO [candidate division WWE3 bacterium]|nr:type 4a pilus biogenesis protein PilO [candidate division WWE3 bacterium]